MAKLIQTNLITPATMPSSETEKLWIYNGLDCCVTLEVFEAMEPQLTNVTRQTYEFRKELQGPVLEMNLRGIAVDHKRRADVVASYEADLKIIRENLDRLLVEGLGALPGINPNSTQQLIKLFYTDLKIPSVKKRNDKGLYVLTVNREALEKLKVYELILPVINHILKLRDIAKKVSVLKNEVDGDGRMHTSYNIAGTNTGRFSSSLSEFGTGGNLQNIEERLRSVYVADPGMKLAYIDLEQAESRLVGAICWNLFHDGAYLDACESGDLHTSVCKLAWRSLPWTGDLTRDKEIAEQPFYRQHSYRHMAKVLGHGTNYNGKPFTMAQHTKLPQGPIKDFQRDYFTAFPAIPRWHGWVAGEIAREGVLTTMLGMRRRFWGRRNDDATIREAIAYEPQSSIGQLLNTGMLYLWRANICQILLQIHDALVIQYPEEREDEVIPQAIKILQVPIELKHGRTLIIPSDAQVGWNWGKETETNPFGLRKYKGHDKRPSPSRLDRQFRIQDGRHGESSAL